jgi:hypothetical protein
MLTRRELVQNAMAFSVWPARAQLPHYSKFKARVHQTTKRSGPMCDWNSS